MIQILKYFVMDNNALKKNGPSMSRSFHYVFVCLMVFNTTFNNILATSWQSV
jgi:hypothetical protein